MSCATPVLMAGITCQGRRKPAHPSQSPCPFPCLETMKLQLRFLPFILLAILALLFALWAGLLRLGWTLPTFDNLALLHGPLMVSGFLGVLIPLERAVAIRQKWMFAVPLIVGV